NVLGDDDEAFVVDVQAALAKLFNTRSGLEWLRQMGDNGRSVTVKRGEGEDARCDPVDKDDAKNGKGTDSTITWNPNVDHHPGFSDRCGSEVVLAHEMVHALHNANGANSNGPADSYPPDQDEGDTCQRNEERSTVGTAGPVRLPGGAGWEPNPRDYSRNV